jgi:hypothetical protein
MKVAPGTTSRIKAPPERANAAQAVKPRLYTSRPFLARPQAGDSISVDQLNAIQSEAEFRKQVIALAEACGFWVKYEPDSRMTRAGWPDLTLLKPPRFLLRELKTIRGRVSLFQADVLAMLRAAGIDAAIWRPDQWEEIVEVLHGRGEAGEVDASRT